MTTFDDGPAAGESLLLKRGPLFLRAVHDTITGEWDALDQFSDEPRAGEVVHAYRRVGDVGWIHINRDRRSGGHFMGPRATYQLVRPQPSTDELRSTASWRRWCQEQQRNGG